MKNALKWRHFMFLAPLFIMLAVFSFYPIIMSFVYSLFDYRTNDQQYNELRTSASLNTALLREDLDYISFFLEDDYDYVDEAGQAVFDQVMDRSQTLLAELADLPDMATLSTEQIEELTRFFEETRPALQEVYEKAPEGDLIRGQDLAALYDDLETVFVPANFVGLDLYKQLLKDSRFFEDLGHTLLFTVISVSLELVLGMGLALIMNKAMRGIGLIRTAALVPWAIPTAVSALMWQYLYDARSGVVAHIFASLGLISSAEAMLSTAGGAMAAAIIADVWKTTPYMALLLLAGLQTIDDQLYESASVDGASAPRTFFHITLPLLKPSILVALLFRTLDAFRVYDLIAVLTGGGPGGTTETLSIYSYKVMIEQSNYGYGSVIVVGMFICVAIIATIFIKVLGTDLLSDE